MIFGIGTDVVEVSRFYGININTFAKRVLSTAELESFGFVKSKELFLAKRFSMKEAISKAFGVGIGKSLSFKDITITKNHLGKPICIVDGVISYNITKCNSIVVHVSASDTQTLVQSFAVVETT